ncbi:MAG: hypothetical protein OdinLCB4_007530 [Candidatus Odinarchaeum yellowstonii]|uniref:Uncharacterized protein n=1 Tax=Odinarchaeota yellowstonii (strain LCB_4) TaxID=1841599 RepID=A0AAF0D2A0_ODILC|nr:MAG: hypothetical protein OdinLCB4_007530 [Candidatus Odinarchaeum yellowstonii]
MSGELVDDFAETFNALIQKLSSTLDQLILEMNSLLSGFDKQTVEVNRLKQLLEDASKASSLPEFTILADYANRLSESLTVHVNDFRELYSFYQKLLEAATLFRENFKSSLTSVQRNFTLILEEWRRERGKLGEEIDSLTKDLKNLREEEATLLEEKNGLTVKLEELQAAYNSLNKQFNELKRDYNLSLDKLTALQESNLKLDRELKNFEKRLENVLYSFQHAYNFFKTLPNISLNLPSYTLFKSIKEPLTVEQLNLFFKNAESVIESDSSLLNSYANSKSFTTALTGASYALILNQAFKNILDVEERERNEIELRICEVEALINDAQLSRYIHTELFKPFIKTARNLLASSQKLLGEVALKLIEQVKLKFEDVELRKTLIRRTGIRGLNLDDCAVESFEIPLDVDRIDASLNNLVESLNAEIFEKRRDLSTFFFESWRDTGLKLASESKLLSYIILSIVKKMLGRANVKDSDLRKLFKKGLFLV